MSTRLRLGRVRWRSVSAHASEGGALGRLLIWLSPAFPVGGFSYSHGLEWVIAQGQAVSGPTLGDWIEDVLVLGSGRADIILLGESWRAVADNDARRLGRVAELALALAPSAERRLETTAQGSAFVAAVGAGWPHPELAALLPPGCETAFPVAVGASAAFHALPLTATAHAFAQAFAVNLVSVGVRLIPLGQSEGLRVVARLERLIPGLVRAALRVGLDGIGAAALAADIASMRHETQYTRLFRS